MLCHIGKILVAHLGAQLLPEVSAFRDCLHHECWDLFIELVFCVVELARELAAHLFFEQRVERGVQLGTALLWQSVMRFMHHDKQR